MRSPASVGTAHGTLLGINPSIFTTEAVINVNGVVSVAVAVPAPGQVSTIRADGVERRDAEVSVLSIILDGPLLEDEDGLTDHVFDAAVDLRNAHGLTAVLIVKELNGQAVGHDGDHVTAFFETVDFQDLRTLEQVNHTFLLA